MKRAIRDIFSKQTLIIQRLFDLYKDLPFLPERKIVNKIETLICNIEDKEKYVVHIKVLKQVLNHGLVLKKST